MIRKIALEIVLFGLLLYSLATVRSIAVNYDPLADMKESVASIGGTFATLPPVEYKATGGKYIFEKNLFNPSRSGTAKPSPQRPERPEVLPVMPDILLKGVLEDTTGKRIAIIEVEGRKAHSYKVGQGFSNFKVVEIGETEVKLERDGKIIKLKLRSPAISKRNSSKNKSSQRRSSRRRSRGRSSREP